MGNAPSVPTKEQREDCEAHFHALIEAAANAVAGLKVFLRDVSAVESLSGVIHEHGTRGRGRVSLVLDRDLREIEMELPEGYQISAGMRSAIKSISGVIEVVDL